MPAVLGSLAELDAVFWLLLQVQPGGSVQWRNRGSVQLAGTSHALPGLTSEPRETTWFLQHRSLLLILQAFSDWFCKTEVGGDVPRQSPCFHDLYVAFFVGNISPRHVRAKAIHQICCHLPCSPVFTWSFRKPSLLSGRPWAFSIKAWMYVMSCSEERWHRSAWRGQLCLSQLSPCQEPAECRWGACTEEPVQNKCTPGVLNSVMLPDLPVQARPQLLHRSSRLQRQNVQLLLLILIQLCVCLCESGARLPASVPYTCRSQWRTRSRLLLLLSQL